MTAIPRATETAAIVRPVCGSWRGYRIHVQRGETPCDWCTHAGTVAALEAERLRPVPRKPAGTPVSDHRARSNAADLTDPTADSPPSQRGAA